MKSKMKTTFALIAVALMIMVAVVPMAGLYTSAEDDIPVVVDPEPATEGITINAFVMDANGDAIKDAFILVKYGADGEYFYASEGTDVDGNVKFTIKDDFATNAVVYVVDYILDVPVPAEGFESKSLGNLVGGNTYNVNFINGEKSVDVTFNAYKYDDEWFTIADLLETELISVNYSVFTDNKYSKNEEKGVALIVGGIAKITYKASLTEAYLQINNFTYVTEDLEEKTLTMKIQAGDMLAEGFEGDKVLTNAYRFLEIGVEDIIDLGLMDVELSTIKDNSETPKTIATDKVKPLVLSKVGNNDDVVYYYAVSDSYGFIDSLEVKLTVYKDSKDSKKNVVMEFAKADMYDADNENVSVAFITADDYETKAFYGTFAMVDDDENSVGAYTGQSLAIKTATKSGEEYTPGKALNVYVYEGNYIAIGATEATYLQVVADGFKLSTINDYKIDKNGYTEEEITLGSRAIVVDPTGYSYIDYAVVMNDGNDTKAVTEDLTLTISDVSSVFGYKINTKDNTVTLETAKGAYELFIKDMDCITFSLANDVEFESGVAGPWIVGKTAPTGKELVIESTEVFFKFVDGDGEIIADNVLITFPETSTLYGLFEDNEVTATYDADTGFHSFVLDASYISPVGAKFIPTVDGYTFPVTAMTYEYDLGAAYMTVVSLDETYSLYLKDASENIVVSTAVSLFDYYLALATINEAGVLTLIPMSEEAEHVGATDITGKMSLNLRSDIAENEPALYSEYSLVYVIVPSTDAYILEEYYLFSPESGVMTIDAYGDSISGIVTKANETPITGALIEVYTVTGAGTQEDPYVYTIHATATTSSKLGEEGTYTLYCAEDMSSIVGAKVRIIKTGYDFDDVTIEALEAAEGVIVSAKDPYIITVEEANEVAYTAVNGDKLTLKAGVETNEISDALKIFTTKASFEVGEQITPTINTGARTFATYTITNDDITSGIITLTTKQVVYLVGFTDYDEEGLDVSVVDNENVTFYAYSDGNFTPKDVKGVQDTAKVGNKYYMKAYALDVLEAPYTDYVISVDQDGTADTYGFDGSKVFMDEDDLTIVQSTSAKVLIFAKDYFGNFLTLSEGNAAPKVPTIGGVNTTIVLGGIQFIQDYSQEKLEITWNNTVVDDDLGVGNRAAYFGETTWYTLSKGAIASDKGLYEVKAFNAAGELITTYNGNEGPVPLADVKITGYTAEGSTVIKSNGAHSEAFAEYTIDPFVAVGKKYTTYVFESAKLKADGYSFDPSESTTFISNEASFTAAFFDLRGIEVAAPTTYVFAALDEDGDVIEAVDTGETIFIDADSVAMFSVFVKTQNVNNQYFKANETYLSLTGDFVSPYTKITGSLPVATDSSNDYVSVDLLLNGVVVDTQICIPGAGQNQYTVYIDLTGETDALAGVPFDSITATYVYRGSVYATVLVDPTAAVNPIVVEPETLYDITLTGSDFILEHLSKKVVGNVAYLTADSMFEIVVQTTQVEGKQMVEKYTFAGWYVNGKAVNASEPTISVELTQTANSASAKYNVETYEVVEPTPEPTPTPTVDNSIDPTVLVIGICAVIVALIAVAYAVISSRPKEKKE